MDGPARGRPWLHLLLVSFAALVFWWQPGVYLNDEVAQSVAMTAFADGQLVINGTLHPGYEPFTAGLFRHFSLPAEGEVGPWNGNVPMMVLGMPVLWMLRLLADGVGIMGALGLVSGAILGGAVALELRFRRRIDWAQWGVLSGSAVFVMAYPRDAGFQATPILDMASQQLAGMAVVAAAAVLLWDLSRRIWGRGAAAVALLLFLLATPAFFWAGNLKYHGFAMAGIAWGLHALWRACQTDVGPAPARRWGVHGAWLEAGLATGISFWNHAPTGLTMMAGFGVVGLTELVRRRSWSPLLGLPGFLIGIVPDLALRLWYRQHGVHPRYFGGSTSGDSVAGGIRDSAVSQVEHTSFMDAPLQYIDTLWELLVWSPYLSTGTAMGVLAMAPWLAFVARKWRPHPLVVWGAIVAAATIVGGGRRLVDIGAGIDQRYVSALWPIFVMAATPAMAQLLHGDERKWLRWTTVWACLVAAWTVIATAVMMAANGGSILYRGFAYDLTVMHRFVGLALFAALLVAWPMRRRISGRFRPMLAVVPMAFCISMWFAIGVSGEMHGQGLSTPFVAWPLDALVRIVRHMYGFS